MGQYLFANGPMPTTAAQAPVTTGTAIKTLLQIKALTGIKLKVIEWGFSFDPPASASVIKVELLETDVAATVTAAAAADITKYGDPNDINADTAAVVLGTAATGYTGSAEGSITAVRMFEPILVTLPAGQGFIHPGKQYPLGREPVVNISKFLRVRVTATVACNAYCYVVFEV